MASTLPVAMSVLFCVGVGVFAQAPPQNPFTAPNGTATMHGDVASSDSTPFKGPGSGDVEVVRHGKTAACPTILAGKDNMPVALVTTIFGRDPVVHLLDPSTTETLATLTLEKGELLGGVYAYLDHQDRLVVVDGHHDMLRIGHKRMADGTWALDVNEKVNVATATQGDGVVGLVPDWAGRTWFATAHAHVGFVDPRTGQAYGIQLGQGTDEAVANSISSCPLGVAVATTHALYLLGANGEGRPVILWRQAYDRGVARKPGQLSWGTGATPTFFGPVTGSEYLTITDNAFPKTHLLVYKTTSGQLIASTPIFGDNNSGTENSPIAYGRSIYVASTYGYPYPALPAGAGKSQPLSAPFVGGMQRIDVRPDESGADIVWTSDVRSTAVPRLSIGDGLIYTFTRHCLVNACDDGIHYDFMTLDAATGKVMSRQKSGMGFMFDTLQMVGNIMPNGRLYQGTLTGIVTVKARS